MREVQLSLVLQMIFLIAVAGGCRDGATVVDSTQNNPENDLAENGESPDAVGEEIGSQDDSKKWDQTSAASADIPEFIPVYSTATAKGGSSDSRLFVFQWETKDSKSDVMEFYRNELTKHGWQIRSEESFGSFNATQGDQVLDVWVGSELNKPTSILIRLTR